MYYGRLAGWVGIICNTLLCAGKMIAGVWSGSVSIMADAVNNLSDASSSVVSLIGFKLSEKRPDEEHPFGHARYEYISGFVVAIFVIVIGVELMRDGIERTIHPQSVELNAVSVAVLVVSIVVKYGMMRFNRTLGRKIDSGTLAATAVDSRNDCITTTAVLAAAIFSRFSDLQLDGPMTVLVAGFIFVSGVELVRDELNPLLGMAPSAEFADYARDKILSYPGVLSTHDLIVHDYGHGRKFATVHVEMAAEQDVIQSHGIIDNIEHDFLYDDGIHLLIHFDPIVTDRSAVGDARSEMESIVHKVDARLSMHDLRMEQCGDGAKVYFDVVTCKEVELDNETLRRKICEMVKERHPEYRCHITVDNGFAAVSSDVEED